MLKDLEREIDRLPLKRIIRQENPPPYILPPIDIIIDGKRPPSGDGTKKKRSKSKGKKKKGKKKKEAKAFVSRPKIPRTPPF